MNLPAIQPEPIRELEKAKYRDAFDPKAYLIENFLQPDSEDLFMAQFLYRAYGALPDELKILEFGGGPSLFTVFTYVEKAREVHFSDFVPARLNEVRCWLNGDAEAFDWQQHIKLLLDVEGVPTTSKNISYRIKRVK